MFLSILAHYTFFSNEVNSFGAFIILVIIGIILIFTIRIWIGNKVDNYKFEKKISNRDSYLLEEANEILQRESNTIKDYKIIYNSPILRNWFQKGYKYGAVWNNLLNTAPCFIKPGYEYSIQEWEDCEKNNYSHLSNDNPKFGGDKEKAIFAYFEGHRFGHLRYQEKGSAQ